MWYLFGTLCNILVYNIFSLYSLCYVLGRRKAEIKRIGFVWFFFLLFCLFPLYSGDWIHYHEKVIYYYDNEYTDLEPVYGMLLSYIGLNYILFRLIVWGVALFFLRALFYRLGLNYSRLLAFFGIWGILFFAYPRVSLGLTIFFYGYSFWIKPQKNHTWSYIIGTILICGSCIFHKSIIELILLLPFTFISLSLKNVLIYIVFSILIIFSINKFLLMQELSFINGSSYFFKEAYVLSMGQQIVDLFLRMPVFVLLLCLVNSISKRNPAHMDIIVRRFFSFVILIVLLSLVFYISNIESQVLFYRTLYMVFIPLSIVLASLYPSYKQRAILLCTLTAYFGGNIWLFYCFLGHLNGSIQ